MRVISGVVCAAIAAGSASAAVNGFVETFDNDSQNWINFNSTTDATWNAAGGPDGSAYASTVLNFTELTVGGPGGSDTPTTFIRANGSLNASGGNIFGNWIAAGITEVSFDIRHNFTGETLEITSRFATNFGAFQNFPGASVDNGNTVVANEWTTITFDVREIGGDILSTSGFPYADVFSNIQWIQLGVQAPDLAGQDVDVTFDVDNFRLVPAPGAAALAFVAGVGAIRRRR